MRKFAVCLCLMALVLGSVPMVSYANNGNGQEKKEKKEKRQPRTVQAQVVVNNNDDDDNDDNDGEDRWEQWLNKNENKSLKTHFKMCRKAFKDLFKGRGISNSTDFYTECLRLVGFESHFVGSTTTPNTPDTTAPILSDLSVTPATTTANVSWHTNENSDSTAFWNTNSNVDPNNASSTSNSSKVTNHSLTLTNLTASTTYYLMVRSRDNSGNTSTSSVISFKTLGPGPVVIDNTAPNVSNTSTVVSTSSIAVSWTTDEPASSRVYYGTSSGITANASTTTFIENLTLKLSHLLNLFTLLPNTVYYMIIESRDASGNATTTPVITATTTAVI